MTDAGIATTLKALTARGFTIKLNSERNGLLVDTTYAPLTDQDRAWLKAHKPEVVSYLLDQAWDARSARADLLILFSVLQMRLEAAHLAHEDAIMSVVAMDAPIHAVWGALDRRDLDAIRSSAMTAMTALDQLLNGGRLDE